MYMIKLRVKEICKEKGITQKQLAEQIGVTEISLSRSINTNPTLATMENIANALNVDVVELFAPTFGEFTALVDHNGEMHRFSDIATLEKFILNIKSGK